MTSRITPQQCATIHSPGNMYGGGGGFVLKKSQCPCWWEEVLHQSIEEEKEKEEEEESFGFLGPSLDCANRGKDNIKTREH